jgi:hypothetical protein
MKWLAREASGKTRSTRKETLVDSLTRKMFRFAGWILKSVTSQSDRALLVTRIASKLSGLRRGRLRLPDHFPEVVQRLTKLTTSQLRNTVYWLKTNERVDYSLKKTVVNYIHQVLPGGYLRTVYTDLSVHDEQKAMVRPLPSSDWPRLGTRSAWPSSPTFVEMLEMNRRGLAPRPINKAREPAKYRITRAEFNSNAGLCSKLISRQVIGIRSDIRVPKKFLGYFEYRWGFLILTTRYNLPIGLSRFLAGQWIRNLHNLWLSEKYSFRNFLKKTDRGSFGSRVPGPW